MRRPLLLSLMVLGLVTTAIGGVGVFAPFTDRATTGTNDVSSGERPRAADLKIAWPATTPNDCSNETFADDSTSPGLSATDVQPGYQAAVWFCLRNAGSLDLSMTASIIDLVEVDFACTGDEAAAGDATCGGDGAGELAAVVGSYLRLGSCGAPTALDYIGQIGDSPTHLVPGTLAAGQTWCGYFEVHYGLNRSDAEVLQAQTDRMTWRLAFDATT